MKREWIKQIALFAAALVVAGLFWGGVIFVGDKVVRGWIDHAAEVEEAP